MMVSPSETLAQPQTGSIPNEPYLISKQQLPATLTANLISRNFADFRLGQVNHSSPTKPMKSSQRHAKALSSNGYASKKNTNRPRSSDGPGAELPPTGRFYTHNPKSNPHSPEDLIAA